MLKTDFLMARNSRNSQNSRLAISIYAIESLVIFIAGTCMHLYGFSIMNMNFTKMPDLSPNASSMLFIISILGVLSRFQKLYIHNLTSFRRFSLFIIEIYLILFVTELLLRQFRGPSHQYCIIHFVFAMFCFVIMLVITGIVNMCGEKNKKNEEVMVPDKVDDYSGNKVLPGIEKRNNLRPRKLKTPTA